MYNSTHEVKKIISEIKSKWRRRALKQGTSLTVLTGIVVSAVLFLVNIQFSLSPLFQNLGMIVCSLAVLAVLIQFVVKPALRTIPDDRIALFIEEKIPDLEDRINSAVEIDSNEGEKEYTDIINKLIDDAAYKAGTIDIATVIDRKKEQILSYTAYALLGLTILVFYTFMDNLRQVASELDFSLAGMTGLQQELFTSISPGNIEIEKGQSQIIVVELSEDTDRNVVLHYRSADDIWKKKVMDRSLDDPVYLYHFLNVQEPVEYFAEVDQENSPVFSISLYEFPKVTGIHIIYDYPSYTGLADRTEENTGTISGLKGSEVTVTIETSGTVRAGIMELDDGNTISLKQLGSGRFQTKFLLETPALYHFSLTDAFDKKSKFPEEYRIIPVDDEKPVITITDPQRDIKASPIEEILVSADVRDDYGISSFTLNFSLNGEAEESVTLSGTASSKELHMSRSYLFLLEDYELQLSDLISYYLEAKDNYFDNGPAMSDMYFIEISPFEQEFTQVTSQGLQGGGGGQQSQVVLNQQQIIAATWKLYRMQDAIDPEEFGESSEALIQAQANLKNNIEDRVNSTAFSMEMVEEEINRNIVKYLRMAVSHMNVAVDELSLRRLRQAIGPEQKALNNLLRADALNREKRVQMNRQRGGQTGQSMSQDVMTELQDLELNLSRDKYELQQQRQQTQQKQEVDETLEKIKDLARRQKKLSEQMRKAQQEEENQRLVDKLRREQEKLRQEAHDLSRQMNRSARSNQQISRQMQERIDSAEQNMSRASQELRSRNLQRAMLKQREAVNDLDRLQQDLQTSQSDNMRTSLDNFMDRFEQFKEQESQLGRDLEQTYREMQQSGMNRAVREDVERLSQKRQSVIENTERLQNLARSVEERALSDNPKVVTDLRNFLRTLQREELEEKMDNSQLAIDAGAFQWAQWGESEIQLGIERLESDVKNLESELPLTDSEKISRNLLDIRDQLRRFEDVIGQDWHTSGETEDLGSEQDQQQGESAGNARGEPDENRESQGLSRGGGTGNSEQIARANELRMRQEMERTQELLDRLGRDFGEDPQFRDDLENLQSNFVRNFNTGVLLDEASTEFFKDTVLEAMSQLEMKLLQRLNEIGLEQKLYEARAAEVPQEYRKAVEKYFETLSKVQNK